MVADGGSLLLEVSFRSSSYLTASACARLAGYAPPHPQQPGYPPPAAAYGYPPQAGQGSINAQWQFTEY